MNNNISFQKLTHFIFPCALQAAVERLLKQAAEKGISTMREMRKRRNSDLKKQMEVFLSAEQVKKSLNFKQKIIRRKDHKH